MVKKGLGHKTLTGVVLAYFIALWVSPAVINTRLDLIAQRLMYEQSIALTLLLGVGLLALVGRLWLAFLIAIPLAGIWWPAEMFMRVQYGQPITSNFIALIFETNRQELFELLLMDSFAILAGLLVSCGGLFLGAKYLRRHRVVWRGIGRTVTLAILASVLFFAWRQHQPNESSTSANTALDCDSMLCDAAQDTFPLNIYMGIIRIYHERNEISVIVNKMNNFKFDVERSDPNVALPNIVFVIGESSKAARWGVYGHQRNTSPRVAAEKNVVVLKDVVTTSLATRTAVPSIVARRPFIMATGAHVEVAEPSIIKAFSEIGYQTYWWSNQAVTGIYDTSTAIYAKQAAETRWLNPVGTSVLNPARGTLDEVLLKPLLALVDDERPKFIVMHTMGSHFNYADRYPPEFNYYGNLRLYDKTKIFDKSYAQKFQDAYDNSIQYTDHLLGMLFDLLRGAAAPYIVIYVSDHGEDIWDEGCFQIKVGRQTAAAYHVPAFVWFNDAALTSMNDRLDAVRQSAEEPLTTADMPQTILDLAGITVNGSITGSALRPRQQQVGRMVATLSGEMSNYDIARKIDPCVIK